MTEEEKYTYESINNAIKALGILLDDVITDALNTRYADKYKKYDFDLITSFDCMVDEIIRIKKVIDLHDALVEAGSHDLLYAFTGNVDNLYLKLLWKEDLQKLFNVIKQELEDNDRDF